MGIIMVCVDESDSYGSTCAEDDVDEEAEAAKRAMRDKIFEIANNLSTKRNNIRAGVFKPSHILPTYSVEQAGIIELEEVRSPEGVVHYVGILSLLDTYSTYFWPLCTLICYPDHVLYGRYGKHEL